MQEKTSKNANFSYRLKRAIVDSGLKQKELAKRIGVSEITISRYCAGTQVPAQDKLAAIAQELARPVSWFFGEESPLLTPLPPITVADDVDIDWKARALAAEERLQRIENILRELFSFAKIGK